MSTEESFYKGFFYGATLGFLAGVIFAPKPGDQTREILSENIKDWKAKANSLVDSAKERLDNAVQEGSEISKNKKYDLYDD
jgi:gas vesicle protein|tara:strand:- start:4528 stop:4770 length:243 start_codon:yes stop_codon:yes gene_type:complete